MLNHGETVKFSLDTYVQSNVSWHNSYWIGLVQFDESVYKDGLVYYRTSTGALKECKMGYYWNGSWKLARYIYVRDNNGNLKIIDLYTKLY